MTSKPEGNQVNIGVKWVLYERCSVNWYGICINHFPGLFEVFLHFGASLTLKCDEFLLLLCIKPVAE